MLESSVTFKPNPQKLWRFFFQDSREEVDTSVKQRQLFLLDSSGLKGSWDGASEDHAKLWAASIANVLANSEAVSVQVEYLLPKLLGYAMGDAKTLLFGETSLPNTGWVGAMRAGYLSFAANLPAVAAKQASIGAASTQDPKWSEGWCVSVFKHLTFGPNITIYPKRYNAIRPVLERLYGVDLPDFSEELEAWREATGVVDFDTVQEIQAELIAEGYDLGPTGADGSMGSKTKAAIQAFQRLHGLTPDGLVGPKTRQALFQELQKRSS